MVICCSAQLDVDGDGIYDRDELDPRNGNAAPGVKDFVAAYGSDTEMMQNQFNPFLRENVPPVLITATAHSDVQWDTCWLGFVPFPCVKRAWTTVHVEAVDVAPFTLRVTAGWLGRSSSAQLAAGRSPMTVEVDIDFWLDYLVEFDVRVDLSDRSGNAMDPPYATRVEGIFAGVLAFLEWLGGALAAVGALIAKALSFLVEWIAQQFSNFIRGAIETLVASLGSDMDGLATQAEVVGRETTLSEWSAPLVLMPLGTLLWQTKEKIETAFTVMEAGEIALSFALMATAIGGAVKTVISKITVEAIKKVLIKLAIGIAIGQIVEQIIGLVDKKALESVADQVFGVSAGVTLVFLAILELLEKIGEKKGGGPKSKYAVGVAWALLGLAIELAGVPVLEAKGLDHGLPLLVLDLFAGIAVVIGLLTLAGKGVFKNKWISKAIDLLVEWLGTTTSGVEQVMTITGAASTFFTIELHGVSGDWWR